MDISLYIPHSLSLLFNVQILPDYEFSEMILYEVQLLMESGKSSEALKHLEDYKPYISDRLAYYETKGNEQ